jgi:hypothetical protein
MNTNISKINREVLKIIKNVDTVSGNLRPVIFWFHSDSEKGAYRFANHLQELNMNIEYCGRSNSDDWKYLLIAVKWMRPTTKKMNNLCKYFIETSTIYNVKYDGWETRIGMIE